MKFHEPFGINQSYQPYDNTRVIERDLNAIHNAGIKWLRTTFDWRHIEHERGKFTFQIYDTLVKLSRERKINLLPILGYCPSWATKHWNFPPRDYNDFSNFIKMVVERYRHDIHFWEIWNEADNYFFWVGNSKEYLKLLESASTAIKEVDPTSKILNCGLSDPANPNQDFFRLITDPSSNDYFDILNLHAYPELWNRRKAEDWTILLRDLNQIQTLEKKPVWITETGYGIFSSSQKLHQANFLIRIISSLFGSGIPRKVFWHEFRDSSGLISRLLRRKRNMRSFGVFQSYNLLRRSILRIPYPTYFAYLGLIKVLSQKFWNGPKIDVNYSSKQLSIQSFQNTDSLILFMWSQKEKLDQQLVINLPIEKYENITIQSMFGESDESLDSVFERRGNQLIMETSLLSRDPILVVIR